MNARSIGPEQPRGLRPLLTTRVLCVVLAGLVLGLGLFQTPAKTALAQSGSIECLSLTMSPATMKDGAMGASYSQTFSTKQNWGCCATPPYVYSIYSGGLPTGLTLSSSGTVTGTPVRPGTYSFGLKSEDSGPKPNGYHCEGVVSVTVTGTNLPPSFTAGPNVTVLEDAPPYSAAWASNISPGGTADAGQTLTFNVTNDNNGLFSVQPAVTTDGKLSFTLKPNVNGVANVDVYLKDNGGTANGGSDTSSMVHFVITVTSVDDVQAGPNFTVNSTAWATDGACTEGNCTLREAITAANGDGVASTIDLAAGAVYTVSGVDIDPNGLQITTPITINAHGAIITRSTAVAAARFFYVAEGGSLTLNEIQLQNGLLTGDVGGAILNDGTLAVLNSMLQYNAATQGGAVYNAGTASLYNNTLYLNTSGEGAVYTRGPFSMYSSTLFNNTLSGGAPATNPTALVLATCGSSSCILFNNLLLSSSSASPLCNFMVTSLSGAGNLATDSSCKFVGVTTYSALNASTPASNGGPTLTMAIGASSTAIDRGYTDPVSANGCKNPNIKNRDQRGYNRVADGNADNVAVCDVGAYEYNSTPLPPTSEPPDTTPPEVRILLTPAQPNGANGWYRSAVTVDPQASDESGIQQLRCMLDPATPPTTFDDLPDAPCPRPGGGIVATDGAHTVFAAAKDVWNNTSVPVSVSFKIDATAPLITCPMAGPFLLGSGDHAVGPAGVDASVSGLNEAASTLSGIVKTDSPGPKTLVFKAVDLAGNEAVEACAYLVMYEFGGFYAPVKNPPNLNKATAGQSVPLKFSLAGDQGLSVIADGYPLSQKVDCATLAALGDPLATEPAGQSGLSYAAGNGWYSYVWKTDKGWAGTCRVLTLQLDDATQHLAYFQLK